LIDLVVLLADVKILNGRELNADVIEMRIERELLVTGLNAHLHEIASRLSAAIALERDVDDDDDVPPPKSRSTAEFKEARILALQLAQVDIRKFLKLDDPSLFIHLVNVISMHTRYVYSCQVGDFY
jgi:hypothetical protein